MSVTDSGGIEQSAAECPNCGLKVWAEFVDDLAVHRKECDWPSDPRERFEVGDRVEYSEFGKLRLDKDHREGKIAGFSNEEHCVRVQWDGNKSATRYAHYFIKHTEGENAE